MDDSFCIELYFELKETHKTLRAYLHNRLAENGITWPQFHALYHIPPEGIPANELACQLNCNSSNITGLTDRMIENGWVLRQSSITDRRVCLLILTPEGELLKNKLIPLHHENIKHRMSVLEDHELKELMKLLKKLKENVNE